MYNAHKTSISFSLICNNLKVADRIKFISIQIKIESFLMKFKWNEKKEVSKH